MGSDADARQVTLGEPRQRPAVSALLPAGIALAGLVAIYLPVLAGMVSDWWSNPASSHGFLVLPLAVYLAWQKRGRVRALARPSWWGLPLLAAALLMYPAGVLTQVEFLPMVSLMVALGALTLLLLGWAACRELAFPYAFLWFMVPWPDTLVEWLSFPMQLFSAKYAAMLAGMLGMAVSRDGVDIHVSDYTFSVGAPCSGMKSLVALLALASLLAYLLHGPLWRRWVLFIAGLPLALLANVGRIVVILAIAAAWGEKAAEGFLHGFSGVLVFAFATAGLLATGKALGLERPALAPPAAAPVAPETAPRRAGWGQALPAIVLLGCTYALVRLVAGEPGSLRAVPADLSALPSSVAGWTTTASNPLDRTSQEMLRPDAYVGRVYSRQDGYPIDLTVVFGHAKETFHSPGYCLLGGGWNILRKDRRSMVLGPDRIRVEANQFSLQRKDDRSVVLYWYASAGESSPSWVHFQYRLLRNRLTGRSPAGALVRITAPVGPSEAEAAAAAEDLADKLYPDLRRLMAL